MIERKHLLALERAEDYIEEYRDDPEPPRDLTVITRLVEMIHHYRARHNGQMVEIGQLVDEVIRLKELGWKTAKKS